MVLYTTRSAFSIAYTVHIGEIYRIPEHEIPGLSADLDPLAALGFEPLAHLSVDVLVCPIMPALLPLLVIKALPELGIVFAGTIKDHESAIVGTVRKEVQDTLDAIKVGSQWGLVDVRPGSKKRVCFWALLFGNGEVHAI